MLLRQWQNSTKLHVVWLKTISILLLLLSTFTEVPGRFKEHNRNYMMLAQKMTEYSKQMSVLALNAAIEAGRLGDNGKLL